MVVRATRDELPSAQQDTCTRLRVCACELVLLTRAAVGYDGEEVLRRSRS